MAIGYQRAHVHRIAQSMCCAKETNRIEALLQYTELISPLGGTLAVRSPSEPTQWRQFIILYPQSTEQARMSLTQGNFLNFDPDRMVVRFTMMNDGHEINCAVSTDAMDHLEGSKRVTLDQREEQFMRLRSSIEARAGQKFLDSGFEGRPSGVILRSIDFRQQH